MNSSPATLPIYNARCYFIFSELAFQSKLDSYDTEDHCASNQISNSRYADNQAPWTDRERIRRFFIWSSLFELMNSQWLNSTLVYRCARVQMINVVTVPTCDAWYGSDRLSGAAARPSSIGIWKNHSIDTGAPGGPPLSTRVQFPEDDCWLWPLWSLLKYKQIRSSCKIKKKLKHILSIHAFRSFCYFVYSTYVLNMAAKILVIPLLLCSGSQFRVELCRSTFRYLLI